MNTTVFLLASRRDKRLVERFDDHFATTRRNMPNVVISLVFLEDVSSNLVPMGAGPWIVIGCLSSSFLSLLPKVLGVRGVIAGAVRLIPLVLSECRWNESGCPFANKAPLLAIASSAPKRDSLFVAGVQRVEDVVQSVSVYRHGRRV